MYYVKIGLVIAKVIKPQANIWKIVYLF